MVQYVRSRLIRSFFRSGQAERIYKGEIVLGFDVEPKHMYYIEHGFIKVYSISSEGDEFIHIVYGPGEIFPLVWGYLRKVREVFYEALDESLLFRVPTERFSGFTKSSLLASNAMAMQLAHQFYIYTIRIDNLEYKKPMQRTAYRLLFLAYRFGKQDGEDIFIEAPFTHQMIADSINLARETVSRVLESMERDQLIYRNHHRIYIKDIEGLKGLVSRDFNVTEWLGASVQ